MSTGEQVLDLPRPATKAKPRQLRDRLQQQLDRTRYPALANVRFEEDAGHVVIRGCVRSYYLKQLAQSIAMRTDGVESITNEIKVG